MTPPRTRCRRRPPLHLANLPGLVALFACTPDQREGALIALGDVVVERSAGQALSAALDVHARAVDVARDVAESVWPGCRAPAPPGPVTVTTELSYVGKANGTATRWSVQRTWARDTEGDVASETRLRRTLPDGRPTERVTEERRVGGVGFTAIDGRFAPAGAIADFDVRIDGAAFGLVDELLSGVGLRGGVLRRVSPGEVGLCARAAEVEDAPEGADVRASVALRASGRGGWLQWSGDGHALTVTFDERVERGAPLVEAPADVWAIGSPRALADARAVIESLDERGMLAARGEVPGAEAERSYAEDPGRSGAGRMGAMGPGEAPRGDDTVCPP